MNIKKTLFVATGCVSLALGTLGIILPLLPTVPLYLLTAYCFARSSEKLHTWFVNTKLYKNNLESYVKGEGMTVKTKVRIMVTVTALMSMGFFMMDKVPVARLMLTSVWVFHLVYFVFRVKTIKIAE